MNTLDSNINPKTHLDSSSAAKLDTNLDNNLGDLKATLVSLLQQLGLYGQANSVAQNKQYEQLTPVSFVEVLRKFKLSFTTSKLEKFVIDKTVYPFVVIPDDEPAFIARRQHNKYEKLVNGEQWQTVSLRNTSELTRIILIEKLPSKKQSTRTFAEQMSKRTKWYKPVFWLSLLSSLTALAVPLFTMSVYDRVIGGQAPDVLPVIAIGAVLALTIFISTRLIRAKLLASVSNRFARDLSDLTFHRLLTMPLMVLSRVGLSNHIARMRNAEKVRSLLSGPGGAGLVDLPFTFIAFATIAFLSGWLVLVPIIMLVIYYLVIKLVNKYTQAATPTLSSDYQQSINDLSKNLLQLKTSGQTKQWQSGFFRQCREQCRQNFLFAKRNGLKAAVAHALSMLTALATVFTGIFLVLNQSISAGALIACVMLIWRITGPAQLAFSSGQKFTMMSGAIKQFDNFMQASTEHNDLRIEQPNSDVAPKITFNHLTLRFSADLEPALSAIDFTIEPGECVAIIGPNGSGKTSLLLSALGVIEAQSGFITINDKNLKQFDPESFRQFASYAPAQADIFPGTLANNLTVAKPDATNDELLAAMHSAGASALLSSLNNNLNTPLFPHGNNMISAVESSYINLARALLKKSKLLILDEPLANRNPFAKKAFIQTLEQLKTNTTVIFSSHDPDLIKVADKVVILDKGVVVYSGAMPDEKNSAQEKGHE